MSKVNRLYETWMNGNRKDVVYEIRRLPIQQATKLTAELMFKFYTSPEARGTFLHLLENLPEEDTYVHFKHGTLYKKLCVAKDSETEEFRVIYQNVETQEIWDRKKTMFEENVEVDGKTVPRFKRLR